VINDHTRVRKGKFTEKAVTGRHFVIGAAECVDGNEQAGSKAGSLALWHLGVAVRRSYRPQPAALDELAEVLHLLLTDGPESGGSPTSTGPESTCFPAQPE
jgi:hypothetical protein